MCTFNGNTKIILSYRPKFSKNSLSLYGIRAYNNKTRKKIRKKRQMAKLMLLYHIWPIKKLIECSVCWQADILASWEKSEPWMMGPWWLNLEAWSKFSCVRCRSDIGGFGIDPRMCTCHLFLMTMSLSHNHYFLLQPIPSRHYISTQCKCIGVDS